MATDAFGRLRVSQPITLFDSFHRFQDNGKISEYTSNNAYSYHNSNAGCIFMVVGSNVGDRIYRESSRVFTYQPGKSLLILQSYCMNKATVGLRQRQGFFDTYNGVYIQMSGTDLAFVRRSSVSGTVKETVVLQDDWNFDKMKGNGPSRRILDMNNVQIMFTDIEWLGAGSVRMGFVIDGKFYVCHIFNHSNRESTEFSDSTLPYMTTSCLPVRAELENINNTGIISTYHIICSSVITEGGYELHGRMRSVGYSTLDAPKILPIKNTLYPVVAIRLKANRLGGVVIPIEINVIGTVSSDYRWALVSNPTLSGGAGWVSAGSDSCIEYMLDATNAITDGTILRMGYFTSTNTVSSSVTLNGHNLRFQLERNSFTGTAFPLVLAVAGKKDSDTVLGCIDFEEIT